MMRPFILLIVVGLFQSEPSDSADGWALEVNVTRLVPDIPSVQFSEPLAASILVLTL